MSNILVAYFSASGETARLAKTLAEVVSGDLYEMKPAQKYSPADLNWNDRHSRNTIEMKDKNARPAIEGTVEHMQDVNVVLLGFPIWWYKAPRMIQTFLESYDFSGKTVIPFCTSGGSELGKTADILKMFCSASTKWKPGKRFNSNAASVTVKDWIDSFGF